MSDYAVLAARLSNELQKLTQVIIAAEGQVQKAKQTGDPDYMQAAALSLQNYSMGVERIFEAIAKQLDGSLPTGANSHQALLEQMSFEIPNQRPAVITADTAVRLNEYRTFRHVVIRRYGFELYPDRVVALVVALPNTHRHLSEDIKGLSDFLRTLAQQI